MRTWMSGMTLLAVVAIIQPAGAQQTFDEQALDGPAPATGESVLRDGKWEVRLGALFQDKTDASFDGGTTVDIDSNAGVRLGISRHLSQHFELGFNLDLRETDYEANITGDAPGELFPVSGELEYTNVSLDATYNLMSGKFTPFLFASAGWSWVDTNISTDPPEAGCWWDPWWGFVCDSFRDTRTVDGFTSDAGVGLRLDFNESYALNASYRRTWHDWDHASEKVDVDSYALTLGFKF